MWRQLSTYCITYACHNYPEGITVVEQLAPDPVCCFQTQNLLDESLHDCFGKALPLSLQLEHSTVLASFSARHPSKGRATCKATFLGLGSVC